MFGRLTGRALEGDFERRGRSAVVGRRKRRFNGATDRENGREGGG